LEKRLRAVRHGWAAAPEKATGSDPVITDFPSLTNWARRFQAAEFLPSRLARGTMWLTGAAVVWQGMTLVSWIVVARFIGKTSFGEFNMILNTVTMLGIFAGLGLGLTATKYVAELRETDKERTGRLVAFTTVMAFVSSGILSLLFYFSAPYLAASVLKAPHLVWELRISCGLLCFNALLGSQTGTLTGFEAFKSVAKVSLIRGLLIFPLVAGGAYWGGVRGALTGQVIAVMIAWLGNWILVRQETRRQGIVVSYHSLSREWPVLWKFALPSVLGGAIISPVMWAAQTLLVRQPHGYAEMGIFSAAYQWCLALIFLPKIIGQTVTPIMSNSLGLGKDDSVRQLLFQSLLIISLMVLLPALVIASFSPWIMAQYGESFREGWPTLIFCLVTAVFIGMATPVATILAASEKMWIGFLMNLGWAIVFLSITAGLLKWGALGLSISYALAYLAYTIWSGYVYVKFLKSGHQKLWLL